MRNIQVYAILLFVMIWWGLNVTMLKVLTTHLDPLIMQSVRILLAGMTIFVLLLLFRQKLYERVMPWKFIFIATFFGVVCHHSLLAIGVAQTTATKTTLICGLSPLLTALLAILFRASTFTTFKTVGFLLGFTGIGIAVIEDPTNLTSLSWGDFYVFLSILLQAFSFFAIRKGAQSISPILMTAYMLVIGGVTLIGMGIVYDAGAYQAFLQIDVTVWAIFIASAVLATAVGHSLYNMAIKHIGAAESAIFTNFNTLFALIGAYIFLGEKMHLQQYVGCVFIIMAVIIGTGGLDAKLKEWIKRRREKGQSEAC
ncbi:DMT family transporter [Lysinibacillus sp. LZ02]|uniref:DMT family transporter n=1 Tax=Lysinibacillus sp. LZ02 TaxID=3420668 RepID=UPI003D359CE7